MSNEQKRLDPREVIRRAVIHGVVPPPRGMEPIKATERPDRSCRLSLEQDDQMPSSSES
jgi:hypothetical protein